MGPAAQLAKSIAICIHSSTNVWCPQCIRARAGRIWGYRDESLVFFSLKVMIRWGTQISGLYNIVWWGLGRTPEEHRGRGTQPSLGRRQHQAKRQMSWSSGSLCGTHLRDLSSSASLSPTTPNQMPHFSGLIDLHFPASLSLWDANWCWWKDPWALNLEPSCGVQLSHRWIVQAPSFYLLPPCLSFLTAAQPLSSSNQIV